jgi:hypothetical protein
VGGVFYRHLVQGLLTGALVTDGFLSFQKADGEFLKHLKF